MIVDLDFEDDSVVAVVTKSLLVIGDDFDAAVVLEEAVDESVYWLEEPDPSLDPRTSVLVHMNCGPLSWNICPMIESTMACCPAHVLSISTSASASAAKHPAEHLWGKFEASQP